LTVSSARGTVPAQKPVKIGRSSSRSTPVLSIRLGTPGYELIERVDEQGHGVRGHGRRRVERDQDVPRVDGMLAQAHPRQSRGAEFHPEQFQVQPGLLVGAKRLEPLEVHLVRAQRAVRFDRLRPTEGESAMAASGRAVTGQLVGLTRPRFDGAPHLLLAFAADRNS
jgi:hypothetical protein